MVKERGKRYVMKKIIALFVTLFLAFNVGFVAAESVNTFVYQCEDGFLFFKILEDYTIEIVSIERVSRSQVHYNINIPSSIEGYPVKSIGENAARAGFFENIYVTIPEGVVTIKDKAFYGVTIEGGLPDSIESIGAYAFEKVGFTEGEMKLPTSLVELGDCAFANSSYPDSIVFPDGLVKVGANPFYSDSNSPFYSYADSNKTISYVVSANHPYLATVDGVLFSKPDKRLISYPHTNDEYQVPEGIVSIGKKAFIGKYVSKITLPSTLQIIGDYAFSNCESLSHITIPENVMYIGQYAFYNTKLKALDLPDGLKIIDTCAFNNCYLLESLKLPTKLQYLGDYALGNTRIAQITIPASVSTIGANPFDGMGYLDSLQVDPGNSRYRVIDYSLYDVKQSRLIAALKTHRFEEFPITEGTKEIGAYALNDVKCKSFKMPGSVVKIGTGAFYGSCSSITLSTNIQEIPDYAFYNSPIIDILIPKGTKTIGDYAFARSRLKDVVIPEGVTVIGDKAFKGCSMENVTLPMSLSYIGEEAFDDAGPYSSNPFFYVQQGSYAEQYCKDHGYGYSYQGSTDWLNSSSFETMAGEKLETDNPSVNETVVGDRLNAKIELPYGIKPGMSLIQINTLMEQNGFEMHSIFNDIETGLGTGIYYLGSNVEGMKTVYSSLEVNFGEIWIRHYFDELSGSYEDNIGPNCKKMRSMLIKQYGSPSMTDQGFELWKDGSFNIYLTRGDSWSILYGYRPN